MEFFKKHFDSVDFEENRGEVKVLCPFHQDSKPSATVNTEKNLFHCWVCGVGYNEEQFLAKVKGITVPQAYKLMNDMGNANFTDWEITHKAELWADTEMLSAVKALGFDGEFIDSMHLGLSYVGNVRTLAIPVFFDNTVMDVRRYNVLKAPNIPKMTSDKGAKSGWIIPYDLLKESDGEIYVFEGEKDMLCARSLGLNAVCLTGGAGAKPNEYVINVFKDRDVIICYDNDKAGREGSDVLGNSIINIAKSVKTLDISQFVSEEKEDFYDYINKYQGNLFEFLSADLIDFEPTVNEEVFTTIKDAMKESSIKTKLTSLVTVTSEFTEAYSVPTVIQVEKFQSDSDKDVLAVGEKRYWTLEEHNLHELLALIEVDAKIKNVNLKALELLRIPAREQGIKVSFKNEQFIYRSVVSDKEMDGSGVQLDLYSFDKLSVGAQYKIQFKLFAHPNKNQRIVAVAQEVKSLDDIDTFTPNKNLLEPFKQGDSVDERVKHLYESAKHHVASHLDYNIWLMSDLVFNSVLEIPYGEIMRGALDVFILGDTQVGKSETTSRLVSLYNFGHFLSLKTSTTVGLIGGSNKVEGSWANTIGAIPRQHKRLAILEEFSGADASFIKTMTDIRSSGILRLSRASGELRAPCMLRMITISNPINDESGSPRFLSSFPNGVQPIMELIKSAEDVTRYDAFLLTPKREGRFNPFANKLTGEPIPKENYVHKAQWVMTRTPQDVWYEQGVESYIWEKAEELNDLFECNVPIFGTTTSKKLARFSVALASLILNTDETFSKVIVTKDIVDYVSSFLVSIYQQDSFKLDIYKKEWESYSKYTPTDLKIMDDLYPANTVMIEFLANQSKTTRANLQAVSGKDRDSFGIVFNQLVNLKALRINMESVYPTEKFRKMYAVMRKTKGEMVTKHSHSEEFDL